MTKVLVGVALLIGVAGVVVGVLGVFDWLNVNEPAIETGERGVTHVQEWPLNDGKPSAFVFLEDPISQASLAIGCTYVDENTYQTLVVALTFEPFAGSDGLIIGPIIRAALAFEGSDDGEIESVGWSFSNGATGREEWETGLQSAISPKPTAFVENLIDSKEIKVKVGSQDQVTFDPRPLFSTPIQWIIDDCGGLE